jgi:ABC-type glycerol-3-phosphate transport system permease component
VAIEVELSFGVRLLRAMRPKARAAMKPFLSHAALMTLSVIFLIPFIWLVTSSFKSESHLFTKPPEWVPRGEFVQNPDGSWAEVVRQEVLEYHPLDHDEKGRALERRPKIIRVNLVDHAGEPLLKELFAVDPPADLSDMDKGIIHDALKAAFVRFGAALPEQPRLKPVSNGVKWQIPAGDISYVLKRQDGRIRVYSDEPSRRPVAAEQIVTKAWPTFRHYINGVEGFHFSLFLQNTLFIAVFTVLGTVLSSSWVAFGFSVIEWRGRDKLFYLMLGTMMLPPQVTMIPVFLIFKSLGWCNTYLPLIVSAFLGNAFFIFLLRQFFLTIPKDLIDAARVDGCSTFRIYWQIVLPLSIPALATVALFTFMWSWNDFMGPLIYVVDETKYTLSLGLAMFKGRYASRYGEMMAVSVLLTLPIIVLFFFTQKTFIQGIKTSGMKG